MKLVVLIDLKLLLRRERRGAERDVCRRPWMMRGIFGEVGQCVRVAVSLLLLLCCSGLYRFALARFSLSYGGVGRGRMWEWQ